jgi:hypothetical protein
VEYLMDGGFRRVCPPLSFRGVSFAVHCLGGTRLENPNGKEFFLKVMMISLVLLGLVFLSGCGVPHGGHHGHTGPSGYDHGAGQYYGRGC